MDAGTVCDNFLVRGDKKMLEDPSVDVVLASKIIDKALTYRVQTKWMIVFYLYQKFPEINYMVGMIQAIKENQKKTMRCFLLMNANLRRQDGFLSETFLLALYYKVIDLVKEVISQGAVISYVSQFFPFNSPHSSAWRIAIDSNNLMLANFLIHQGIDLVMPIHPDGFKPLDYAKGRSLGIERRLYDLLKDRVPSEEAAGELEDDLCIGMPCIR